MTIQTPIQAVAFDLDGTLCDSIPDLAAAANAMRQTLGMAALPDAAVQSYVGDGIGVLVHRALTDNPQGTAPEAQWQQGYTAFVRHYADHIADHTRAYPETEAGLALLQSLRIPLAVITNKNEILAVKLLKALKLDGYFSIVIGGDTLPEKKPSPEPLRHVAQVLGVNVANIIMVGDSKNDILSAKAAGSIAVGVTFGYGDMAQLSQNPATKPDWTINALPDIYTHLRPQKSEEE